MVVGNIHERRYDGRASASAIDNLRIGFAQTAGRWTLREFARLNNFTNENYVGTVIVGDVSDRYFEPAATRNFLIGVSVNAAF